MKLASVRLISADIKKMVAFYEMVTGIAAEWLAPVFAEIVTPGQIAPPRYSPSAETAS